MENKHNQKLIVFCAGIALFIIVGFLLPVPEVLASSAEAHGITGRGAMCAVGGLLFAVGGWVSGYLSDWEVSLFACCIWVLTTGLSFAQVFAGFHSTSLWLMFGAFGLSAAVAKSGLLSRIALNLMLLFPANFKGQVLALLTSGTVVCPLMPSFTAKVALGCNLSNSLAEYLGYEKFSRGRTGIFIAAWAGFGLMSGLFLSASFIPYSVLAVTPKPYDSLSWTGYMIMMIPWGIIMFLGMYLVLLAFYRPKTDEPLPKDELRKQKDALGKLSREEKLTAIIIICCLILWILEKQLGISSAVVAVLGGLACFAGGVLNQEDALKRIPWKMLVFVGVVINIGNILELSGVTGYIEYLMQPLLGAASNKVVFAVVIFFVVVALRFLIASQTATGVLIMSIFGPLAVKAGLVPLCILAVSYPASNVWITSYQNTSYIAGTAIMRDGVRHKDTLKASICHLIVCLIGCLVSIPYWSALGFM